MGTCLPCYRTPFFRTLGSASTTISFWQPYFISLHRTPTHSSLQHLSLASRPTVVSTLSQTCCVFIVHDSVWIHGYIVKWSNPANISINSQAYCFSFWKHLLSSLSGGQIHKFIGNNSHHAVEEISRTFYSYMKLFTFWTTWSIPLSPPPPPFLFFSLHWFF